MSDLAMTAYYKLPGLDRVYLEDSFVLDVEQSRQKITFSLEVVLQETHSLYESPKPGENYCYRQGRLLFSNVTLAIWENLRFKEQIDPNGAADFGNIDEFFYSEGCYVLSGDWGQLRVASKAPRIDFE